MSVSIVASEFYAYRMPLTPPFISARGTVGSVVNFITIVRGEQDGFPLYGIGESAPRGPGLTGDDLQGIGRVISLAGERLRGLILPSDPNTAVTRIGKFLDNLTQQIRGSHGRNSKPYRGSLSGIEMALLDL